MFMQPKSVLLGNHFELHRKGIIFEKRLIAKVAIAHNYNRRIFTVGKEYYKIFNRATCSQYYA